MAPKDFESLELIEELEARGYQVINPRKFEGIYLSEEDVKAHNESDDWGCPVCGA
jgi:hypothetical protein